MFEYFFISCIFFSFYFWHFPHGAVDLLDPKTGKVFKINAERVKPFVKGINEVGDQIPLQINVAH